MDAAETQLVIRKVLDISTAHVRKESTKWLDEHASLCGDYGWLASVFYCLEEDNESPSEIMAIAEACQKQGIYDIYFDCDGEQYEAFEKFDW